MARRVAYPDRIEPWCRGPRPAVRQQRLLARALITLLGKIACRDNFSEMHPFKHHQATYEEFHATRPSLRWCHIVSAVQAAAISNGRIQDVYEQAAEVMHF